MTKRERAQVVELLRCAADIAVTERWHPLFGCGGTAANWLGTSRRIGNLAENVTVQISGAIDVETADAFIHGCLEAAARVEEGSWP